MKTIKSDNFFFSLSDIYSKTPFQQEIKNPEELHFCVA